MRRCCSWAELSSEGRTRNSLGPNSCSRMDEVPCLLPCNAAVVEEPLFSTDELNLSRKFVVPVATTEKRIKFDQVEVKEKVREEESGEVPGRVLLGAGQRSLRERGRTKGKGRGKERSHKGKGKADEEETEKGLAQGEMILDLDTPLR